MEKPRSSSIWPKIAIEISREVDQAGLTTLEDVDARDGMMLNHSYFNMSGYSIADARAVLEEEAELLERIAAVRHDEEGVNQIVDELQDDASELCGFDVGVAGAIYALSAAGAAPITSCNGGLLGGCHQYHYPNVLFSIHPNALTPIVAAAEQADVGLANASGHVLVYGDSLASLHVFADGLLRLLEEAGGTQH